MADTEPEVNVVGMAASLYALGMSFPGIDRVEVSFNLTPTFEVELSEGGGPSAEAWLASATVRAFSMGGRGDFAETHPETLQTEVVIEGGFKGTPDGAYRSLQGKIRERLQEEAGKAKEASARFEALGRAIH